MRRMERHSPRAVSPRAKSPRQLVNGGGKYSAFNAEIQDELDRLRERIKGLCKRVQARGASAKHAEEQARMANNEIEALQEVLAQAKIAKLEALEYNAHSKAELVHEVQRLHGILLEAKLESEEKDQKIEALELHIEKLKTRNDILSTKLELQHTRFVNMLAEESQSHFEEVENLRASITISSSSSYSSGEPASD